MKQTEMRKLKYIGLAAATVGYLLLSGCVAAGTITVTVPEGTASLTTPVQTQPDMDKQIVINKDGFVPESIQVYTGDTITWVNNDDTMHTVTSWREYQEADGTVYVDVGKAWNSGDIEPGGSFSRTFGEAGVFEYLSFPLYLYTVFQGQPVGTVNVS